MIEQTIARINALAKKAKTVGLTPEETAERDALRREYIAAVKRSLTDQLDNTYLVDAQGNRTKLQRKNPTEATQNK